jgi:hypothetical protein
MAPQELAAKAKEIGQNSTSDTTQLTVEGLKAELVKILERNLTTDENNVFTSGEIYIFGQYTAARNEVVRRQTAEAERARAGILNDLMTKVREIATKSILIHISCSTVLTPKGRNGHNNY